MILNRLEFLKRLLGHRRLPLWLAVGAILAMLPALNIGLVADDLVQRPFQFKASELPAQARELFPADTGSLRGVLSGLFGKIVNRSLWRGTTASWGGGDRTISGAGCGDH